ncbi:MAG: hypothetical protein ACYSSL_01550 [Planctomycetota bacterium]|jgi:hypothetical protein
MKKKLAALIVSCLLLTGCETVRFTPGEAQKQNAWLHNRTTMAAAEKARTEKTSEQLQALTGLSEVQSRAFTSYYGLPKQFPQAETVEDILSQSNSQLAKTALSESADRPDVWQLADSGLELAIGVTALLGGVYSTRAVRFLQQAKGKSKALQEIIKGNELFKKEHKDQVDAFKQAHNSQSLQTRRLVAELKS